MTRPVQAVVSVRVLRARIVLIMGLLLPGIVLPTGCGVQLEAGNAVAVSRSLGKTSAPVTSAPTSAGPTSAGPTSAGPTSAGPTSAGPTSAGPASAGPTSAGPTSAGPTSAGPASLDDISDPIAAQLLQRMEEGMTGLSRMTAVTSVRSNGSIVDIADMSQIFESGNITASSQQLYGSGTRDLATIYVNGVIYFSATGITQPGEWVELSEQARDAQTMGLYESLHLAATTTAVGIYAELLKLASDTTHLGVGSLNGTNADSYQSYIDLSRIEELALAEQHKMLFRDIAERGGSTLPITFWLDPDRGLPIQIMQDVGAGPGAEQNIIAFAHFDEPLTILAPDPAVVTTR
ncbi:hypothetical protein [Nakamurella antarctica]|uniref:hypothetical protein n=1 Tax=Nakamurella antarctica TaxID=1902245 RepID=UPI001EF072A9|nr:hypothetical protein [Nakamurella antarctica]